MSIHNKYMNKYEGFTKFEIIAPIYSLLSY